MAKSLFTVLALAALLALLGVALASSAVASNTNRGLSTVVLTDEIPTVDHSPTNTNSNLNTAASTDDNDTIDLDAPTTWRAPPSARARPSDAELDRPPRSSRRLRTSDHHRRPRRNDDMREREREDFFGPSEGPSPREMAMMREMMMMRRMEMERERERETRFGPGPVGPRSRRGDRRPRRHDDDDDEDDDERGPFGPRDMPPRRRGPAGPGFGDDEAFGRGFEGERDMRGPPRRAFMPFGADEENANENEREVESADPPPRIPSLKERCDTIARIFDSSASPRIPLGLALATTAKVLDRHVVTQYSNHHMPMAGQWYGPRGFFAMVERAAHTIQRAKANVRVLTVDEGFQRCVLKANITGTFERSKKPFTDAVLYATVDWRLGRISKVWFVDGGNLNNTMAAYRTDAESKAREIMWAIATGKGVDEFVSDKAIAILGRKMKRFEGKKALTESIKHIKAESEKYGFKQEELPLPFMAEKSRSCELMMADKHNLVGQCRVYNMRTRTTSFKHIDMIYRLRFDDAGKLDRLSIVEARPFTASELMEEKKNTNDAYDDADVDAVRYDDDDAAVNGATGVIPE